MIRVSCGDVFCQCFHEASYLGDFFSLVTVAHSYRYANDSNLAVG